MDFIFNRPNRDVDRVFLHCSASSLSAHDDVEVIRGWHLKNGWSDIGYNYYITFDGTVHNGRDAEKSPAAQRGHNTGTLAICLSGLHVEDFTEEQFFSLKDLCKQINDQITDVTFHGHCEVSDKECPVFDYKTLLGLDTFGELGLATKLTDKKVLARQEFIDLFEELVSLDRDVKRVLGRARDLGDIIDEL